MTESLRIVVAGRLAGVPDQGGASWAILQYLLGFRGLGHDVWFVEPIGADEDPLDRSPIGRGFGRIMRSFGLEDRSTMFRAGSDDAIGVPLDRLRRGIRDADLLLNVSGVLDDESLLGMARRRAYLDLDPAFTQLWQETEGIDMGLKAHDRHVTVGLAVGDASSTVPTLGLDWLTTLPPVVLDEWTVGDAIDHPGLTTVGNWRGYGSVEWQGVMYGQRAHSFRELMHLPRLTREPLMPALSIHPDERPDVEALEENGWRLLDPGEVASTPERYRSFVRGSKGELGVAKSGYVLSRSGWFSDRSACYLAAGRPVIAQDTGFSRYLPTGTGLMAFDTAEDAAARIDDLNARYREHRSTARSLAEDTLDSRVVLTRLLEGLGEGT